MTNLLIFGKMGNDKFRSKIEPLTFFSDVKKLYVIRSQKSFKNKKIVYKSTTLKNYYGGLIIKLLLGLNICQTKNIQIVLSYFLVPHGLIGLLCSKLVNKPSAIFLLGSDLDLYLKKSYFNFLYFSILKEYDLIVVRGNTSKNFLLEKGFPDKKINIINNYLDYQRFKPLNLEKTFDVIFVGQLNAEKRVDILISALANINDRKIKALIIGDGPLRQKLQSKIDMECSNHEVKILGYRKKIEYYLNKSKMLVLSSEREGFPMVICEAMACGVPCIVSDVGDVKDLINDKSNSLIFPPLDYLALSNKILELLNNKVYYQKVSTNGILSSKKFTSPELIRKQWRLTLDKLSN